MKSKTAFTIALAALLLVMTITALHIPPAKAQGPTPVFPDLSPLPVVYVSPPEITIEPSQLITVNVYISSSVELDLFAWQINMTWDPNIMNFSSHAWGDEPAIMWKIPPLANNETGQLLIGCVSMNRSLSVPVNSTTSPLCLFTVTFECNNLGGASPISLVNVELFGISDDGNGWPLGGYNFGFIPENTSYDRWPDLNGDGVVDIYDAILEQNHFGLSVADTNWNPICDFNEDSVADTFDCAILMANFGKTNVTDPTWPGNDPDYPLGLTNTIYMFNADVQNGVTVAGTNLAVYMNAPSCIDDGNAMNYSLYYVNFGDTRADNVVLNATLSSDVNYVDSSGGTYDRASGNVTWDLDSVSGAVGGAVSVESETINVTIPSTVPPGTIIQTTAEISTDTAETNYNDNYASVNTTVTPLNLPPGMGLGPIYADPEGTPQVNWNTPITFTYYDSTGTVMAVNITMAYQGESGAIIMGPYSMVPNGPSEWTSTHAFSNHGYVSVMYFAEPSDELIGQFPIYVDPAGYVYDAATLERIAGATVWLQRPDGLGGWENVPTGQTPAIMQPDVNPQTTGADGQYQWDVLNGSYRVYVEAPGYYPADSILVTVPPPVTDLDVGLIPTNAHDVAVTNVTADRAWVYQGFSANINVTVANQGNFTETFNVTAYANATITGSENVTLPAGNSTTVTFTWNTTGFAYGNYTLSAYAWPVPGETNTTNNNMTGGTVYVGIPGDINGDGTVDIYDAIMLSGAFGSSPGSASWNPNADVNGDGIIDIYDAIIIAGHFGQNIP